MEREQKTGFSAMLAIILAAGSYLATFTGSPIIGLLAALAALPLGILGLVMAASPRIGGGLLSILAILLAIFAVGIALLGILGILIF